MEEEVYVVNDGHGRPMPYRAIHARRDCRALHNSYSIGISRSEGSNMVRTSKKWDWCQFCAGDL